MLCLQGVRWFNYSQVFEISPILRFVYLQSSLGGQFSNFHNRAIDFRKSIVAPLERF